MGYRLKEVGSSRRTGIQSSCRSTSPQKQMIILHSLRYTMGSKQLPSTKAEWRCADPWIVALASLRTMQVRTCIIYLPNDLSFSEGTLLLR